MTSGNPGAPGAAGPPSAPAGGGPQYTGGPQFVSGPVYGSPRPPYGATPRPTGPSLGVVGLVLSGAGAIVGIIAFTAVTWFSDLGRTHFQDVHHLVNALPRATKVADAYFGWLAWLLLAVAVICAVAGCVPSPASAVARALGVVVSLAAIALTFWAIKFSDDGANYSEFLKHARVGFYLALGAFVLTALGAGTGPSRRT